MAGVEKVQKKEPYRPETPPQVAELRHLPPDTVEEEEDGEQSAPRRPGSATGMPRPQSSQSIHLGVRAVIDRAIRFGQLRAKDARTQAELQKMFLRTVQHPFHYSHHHLLRLSIVRVRFRGLRESPRPSFLVRWSN